MIDLQQALVAILNFYQHDPAQVRRFYTAAESLRGRSPVVDAILNEVDAWLIATTFTGQQAPDLTEVLSWPDTL